MNKVRIILRDKEYKEKNKERYKEYHKYYAKNNREKIAEYGKGYREKNKDKISERMKRHYNENKEYYESKRKKWITMNYDKYKAYHDQYRKENIEKIQTCGREYYAANKDKRKLYLKSRAVELGVWRKEYYERNKARINEYSRSWAKKNRGKRSAADAARRCAKILRTPVWADMELISEIYKAREKQSKETGVALHVDHIVPLQGDLVCGLHVHQNLRIITAEENLSKYNKFDVDLDSYVNP